MAFLFEIANLRGYHAIIEGAIRRGVGADTIHRELARTGVNIPRGYVRGFGREIRAQIGVEGQIARLWARRDINRTLYLPVSQTSRYDWYYNFTAKYIDPKTGEEKTTALSVTDNRELSASEVSERIAELIKRYEELLPPGVGEFTLTTQQRRVGI